MTCRDEALSSGSHVVPSYSLPQEVAKGENIRGTDHVADERDVLLRSAIASAQNAAKSEEKLRAFLMAPHQLCGVHRAQIEELRDTTKSSRDDAVRALGTLASKNVDWTRRDEVLFRLSWELERRGETEGLMGAHKAALTAYGSASRMRKSLETLYPTSPWLPLALIDEGSRRFKSGATMAALELYKRALKSPALNDHLRAYLLYRSAWCYLHKGNVSDSRRLFDTARAVTSRHRSERWSTQLDRSISTERR